MVTDALFNVRGGVAVSAGLAWGVLTVAGVVEIAWALIVSGVAGLRLLS